MLPDASADDVTLIMSALLEIRADVRRILDLLEEDEGEEEEEKEDT